MRSPSPPVAEEKQLQIKVHHHHRHRHRDAAATTTNHHHRSSSPLPPNKIYQPFKTHFTWLVPTFVVTNIILFVVAMYINDCPKNSPKCLGADLLGRFAFQPLKENPLLGPSGAT